MKGTSLRTGRPGFVGGTFPNEIPHDDADHQARQQPGDAAAGRPRVGAAARAGRGRQRMRRRGLREGLEGRRVGQRGGGELLATVRNLGKKGAFAGVNFDVFRGEVLGFAGLVGAFFGDFVRTRVAPVAGRIRRIGGQFV